MATLSVVVSVYNGEKYLENCLLSVNEIADEIIVVDHESTDKSLAIAKKFTKRVFSQKNNPNDIDRQKNYGFEKATKEWILSLDADEKLTLESAQEIKRVLSSDSIYTAYRIPRKNIIFDKWIQHTGWYPDYQLRLFVKGKGKYVSKHVHEELELDGSVSTLMSPLEHEAYQSIYQFLHRGLTVYALNEAESLRDKGYKFSFSDCIKFPLKEFLSRFFARSGYKDGFHGLMLSLLMASYHLAVFAYLWEYEKFPETNNASSLLLKEIENAGKELTYWSDSMHIEQTKNPAKKILLRAKRKLRV